MNSLIRSPLSKLQIKITIIKIGANSYFGFSIQIFMIQIGIVLNLGNFKNDVNKYFSLFRCQKWWFMTMIFDKFLFSSWWWWNKILMWFDVMTSWYNYFNWKNSIFSQIHIFTYEFTCIHIFQILFDWFFLFEIKCFINSICSFFLLETVKNALRIERFGGFVKIQILCEKLFVWYFFWKECFNRWIIRNKRIKLIWIQFQCINHFLRLFF